MAAPSLSDDTIYHRPGGLPLGALLWPVTILAVLALILVVSAWGPSSSPPPAVTDHPVRITDVNDPAGPGPTVRVESAPFHAYAGTWAVYWSYYCLMPGVHSWSMRARIVSLSTGKARTIYAAASPVGPVSYTEILQLHGTGTYRFIVDATPRCVWSLRAPPVAGQSASALGAQNGQGGEG